MNKVTSYKELDSDLQRSSQFSTLVRLVTVTLSGVGFLLYKIYKLKFVAGVICMRFAHRIAV